MDAQWERTDPFHIHQATADMTWKLSNLTNCVDYEFQSFGSSLGVLSSQLQLFSVHVSRKL